MKSSITFTSSDSLNYKISYCNHIITPRSATVVMKKKKRGRGQPIEDIIKTIKHTDDRFNDVCRAIKKEDFSHVIDLLNPASVVEQSGDMQIKRSEEGKFYLQDKEGNVMPDALAAKIRMLATTGKETTALEAFWHGGKGRGGARGLMKNPSKHSQKQLYTFIENGKCNITKSGHFILYKGINHEFMSIHASSHKVQHAATSFDGKTKWEVGDTIPMVHKVGKFMEIPREDCADNPQQTCDRGLHAAPWDYVNNYYGGRKKIELLIDPADVVSVPADDHGDKLRCCRYRIIRIMGAKDTPHESFVIKLRAADTSVAKRVAKNKEVNQMDVDFTTDRITIPLELCDKIGVKPSSTVTVFATDPRSRFIIVVSSDVNTVKRLKEHVLRRSEPVFEQKVITSSRGTVSIRERLLRLAKISGHEQYMVKVVQHSGYPIPMLEIRKAN